MKTSLKPSPINLLRRKEEMLKALEYELDNKAKNKASKDPHAIRPPRWCGMTVHAAINCPFECIYCYIKDMGFKQINTRPYPLPGKLLTYALLKNPSFFPGKLGTLIAIGSISEPFLFPMKVLEYIKHLANLGNPIQFSSKAHITSNIANKLSNIIGEKKSTINPLITIITLNNKELLEPKAPSVEKRLDSISNLKEAGLKPVLFLRPIIPGVNQEEIPNILKEAKDAGAIGVVFGSFRVTKRILENLKRAGFDISKIVSRVSKIDEKQRAVALPEKKNYIVLAKKVGLIAWNSTCCANSWTASVPCASSCFIDGPCTKCPNSCNFPENSSDKTELAKALSSLDFKFKITGKFVKMLNHPFPGSEFAVRTLSRMGTILSRTAKKEKKIKSHSQSLPQT